MDNHISYINNANPAYIEELYQKYLNDPTSVEESWHSFFEGYSLGNKGAKEIITDSNARKDDKEANVTKLIQAYRARGHLNADLNPLKDKPFIPDLQLNYYNLDESDLNTTFNAGNELKIGPAKLNKIIQVLNSVYAEHLTVEFIHCDQEIRQWIYNTLEPTEGQPNYTTQYKQELFETLSKATTFETFLQTKYVGQKRFGIEGGESVISGLKSLIKRGVKLGVKEFVFGMAHRGRLNVLVNIFNKSYHQLFNEFEGGALPEKTQGDGDVKYHLGQSTDITIDGQDVHLSLAFNPSHLEAVNCIVTGMVRGKCKKYYEENEDKIIPVLIHGDASVAGQGVVYEHANMSKLRGYQNGGSIHLVINNQIGFTANSTESRTSHYCTDVAKITNSPIFHVNGDNVEKVSYALELAMEIRNKFHIDVWVDIIGYRKRGHNEADEPRFTQPLMYQKIDKKTTTHDIYLKELIKSGILTTEKAKAVTKVYKDELEKSVNEARKNHTPVSVSTLNRYWQKIRPATSEDFTKNIPTEITHKTATDLMEKILNIPKNFNLFSKMKKTLENRRKLFFDEKKVDWGIAEHLAFASLLNEGHSVRVSGQDSQRGTFGHRHAVLKDTKTEKKFYPLNNCIKPKSRAKFRVLNSQLSEYSVMGYEYGYSLTRPHALVIWEAQFGDFSNGAQIIIDQFLSSGETKWQRHSGLILLLPHGYEGMGPEHSSARLERFLQLCAKQNMYVVNITEPANFFHAIRRQIKAPFRKPLIVMSPKSLLRHPLATSPTKRLSDKFIEIIDDPIKTNKVDRVIFCTGKIYYDLLQKRDEEKKNISIVRLEQIYPLQKKLLQKIRDKYSNVKEWLWVQEEPINMGAWTFINNRLSDFNFLCVARRTSSSPAAGIAKIHTQNQTQIVGMAITETYSHLKKLKKY